jgi:CheY-like chemotaxis protein
MDGWQTIEAIRGEVAAAQGAVPMVFMVTAHGREMLAEQTTQSLALLNGFLVKPVTAMMLQDAVNDAQTAALSAASGHNPARPQKAAKAQRLPGMRILVVEDNKINQVVAHGLLTQEGAVVTLADNGRLGVDAVLAMQPPYDVVLMDLQMPVMDGYEATRTIREIPALQQLPIIAMTANAMASDREACLAAGMNDHVGKPFEIDHLVATLLKRTGRSDAHATTVAHAGALTAAARPAVEASSYALGDLDSQAALKRVGGNEAMYRSVLQAFASDVVQVPQRLRDQWAEDALAEVSRTLHSLKGVAATVGARHVSAVAAALEKRAKDGIPAADRDAVLAQLQASIDAVVPAVHAALAAMQGSEPQTGAQGTRDQDEALDRVALRHDLEALARMLDASDMVALEAHAAMAQKFSDVLPEAMQPLQEAMAMLDFTQARKICEDLITKVCR